VAFYVKGVETMLDLLAAMVVLVLVGPLLIIGAVGLLGLLLLVTSPFSENLRRTKETFRCPLTKRIVTAEFLLPEGAAYPREVMTCTAFRDPKRIVCNKGCLAFAQADWGPSRGIFPRWALTAGGVVTWREPDVSVRAA
jgi:hypothetical protein